MNDQNEGVVKSENAKRSAVRPQVDVYESDAEILLVADLPGVARDGLELRLDKSELVIDARRTPTRGGTSLVSETVPRDFHRSFAVPEGIDAERIDAALADGVLRVRLPKFVAKQTRRIEIRA